MSRHNPVVSMLQDYLARQGQGGLSDGMSLQLDPNTFSMPSSLSPGPQQTYGASGTATTDYSRTSRPNPVNVDDYLAKMFPPQAPAPQPGKWEKALGGVGNAIQGFHNDMMGYPHSLNSGPGGWSTIGSLVDALNGKKGSIGTPMPMSQGGQIGAMQGIAGMDPGAMVAAMRMLGGSGVPASAPQQHAEPDADDKGGPSDRDADNGYISGVPNNDAGLDPRSKAVQLNMQSPGKYGSVPSSLVSGFSKALGGLKGPDTGMLAGALKSAAANYPTERATGRMSSGAFVGGPVNPTSMGGSPSASSMMGQRPQPKLMGQDYQLGDYTLPQRKRTTGFGGDGSGI